jgi:pimeloyl-ACP methyl ester carboxylesterase
VNIEPNASTIVRDDRSTVPTRVGPLHVRRCGGQGPWLLLWHSLFLDGRSWDALLPKLTAVRTVLVVDGPCHGSSPGPETRFSLDDCAEAAAQVLDHFGVKRVDWIGNAWGGHVGVVLAASRPDRVASVAALSSPMQALGAIDRLRFRALASVFRVTGWTNWLADAVVDGLVLPTASTDARRYVREAARAPGAARTRLAMRSVMFGRPSLVERLASVGAPTLFVTSPDDPMWPPALAEAHAKRLGRGRLEILAGARHAPPVEAPDATATLLLTWLASTSRGRQPPDASV